MRQYQGERAGFGQQVPPKLEHPTLSVADRDLLARQISALDGITYAQAHRQIEEMLSSDLNRP
jgi:phage FluMu protein gp41